MELLKSNIAHDAINNCGDYWTDSCIWIRYALQFWR